MRMLLGLGLILGTIWIWALAIRGLWRFYQR